jgi:hypothetical protein
VALQLDPQAMPAGELVTLPLPLAPTESVWVIWVNVAVTLWLAPSDTVQLPVPPQPAPLHPAKLNPAAGAAFNVI